MEKLYLINVTLLIMIISACQPTPTDTAVSPEPTNTPTMAATRPLLPHEMPDAPMCADDRDQPAKLPFSCEEAP